MNTIIIQNEIGMRELLRSPKKIKEATGRGQSFIVYDHRQPVFRVVPIKVNKKKYTIDDIRNMAGVIKTKPKHLNKTDNELVYGI